MPSPDDFELLSRFAAGELAPADAQALQGRLASEPELRQMLEALRQLDVESAGLSDALSDARAETLVQGALRPAPGLSPRWARFAIAAGVLGLAVGSLFVANQPARPTVVAVAGEARAAGVLLEVGRSRTLVLGETIEAGADGAVVATVSDRVVLLARNSSVRRSSRDGFELLAGVAVFSSGSGEVHVQAGTDQVVIRGRAVLMMEPEDEVIRVTAALTPPHTENTLKTSWMMLGPAAAGAALGATLTLFVMHGEVAIASADAAVTRVGTGERWNHGEPRAVAPGASGSGSAPQAGASDARARGTSATAYAEPAEFQPLSRAQLVARIEALRDDKEQLLREKAELKRKLEVDGDDHRVARNYYRLSAEELAASAKKGELHLRLNLEGQDLKVKTEVAERVGLTPSEQSALKKIYADSASRVHAGLVQAYRQIGGDVNAAEGFTTFALLEELRSKSLKDDYTDGIRQLANERAGLVPPGDPSTSSAILNAYRLLWNEDDRVVNEVEALLGPSRAEQYLNDKDGDHSDHTWGVGPAKK